MQKTCCAERLIGQHHPDKRGWLRQRWRFDQLANKRKTVDKLVSAAQGILKEAGIEALNSNAIVERAGVTPPTFYHYFANKHALLRELGILLMQAQSETLRVDTGLSISNEDELRVYTRYTLQQALSVTQEFEGGYALMVSLRALPDLRDVRIDYHDTMADFLVTYLSEQGLCSDAEDLKIRAKLSLGIAYSTVETLIETDFADEEKVLDLTADAIVRVYDLF